MKRQENVLVIGASRGIGLELVKQYLEAGCTVTATARKRVDGDHLRQLGACVLTLDVTDITDFYFSEPFDLVIYCAGVYVHCNLPQAPSTEEFYHTMHTNVLGAMKMLPHMMTRGYVTPGGKVIVISSRMGSIGDRTNSMGWVYRASKSALNSVVKDLSLAFGIRAIFVAMHPGWVKTDMGGQNADLEVEKSVKMMRSTVASLRPTDSGRFINYDGSLIDW
jgi:NAD(P)-dependent dehydrogenase (short-subunit alcohol dehydrogenase family)